MAEHTEVSSSHSTKEVYENRWRECWFVKHVLQSERQNYGAHHLEISTLMDASENYYSPVCYKCSSASGDPRKNKRYGLHKSSRYPFNDFFPLFRYSVVYMV